MTRTADENISSFLTALASKQPTPGGGAAAALTASQGAALLSMVLNLTVGRKRFRSHDDVLRPVLKKCEEARAAALQAADDDAEAFSAVMDCYGLPKSSDEEKRRRNDSLETASIHAAIVPLRLLRNCLELLRDARTVGELGNRTVLTDVIVGAQLLRAAADGCQTNILINLKNISSAEQHDGILQETRDLARDAREAESETLAICRERLKLPS